MKIELKTLLKVLAAFFLVSCSSNSETGNTIITPAPSMATIDTSGISTKYMRGDSFDSTIVVNQKTFTIQTKEIKVGYMLLTVSFNSKNILADTLDNSQLSYIKFVDLNKDNNLDILISWVGNNITSILYLFNPADNTFRNLDGFIKYPEAVQLKSFPEFYYSYHRGGCADYNWVSDLFKIENFKTIQLGHIWGQGCEGEPQAIEIYKINDNNEENGKLLEKLPYLKNIPEFGDKWDFIERYWNNNFKKFK